MQNIDSHESNSKNFRSFDLNVTEQEQFLFGPVDFSEICDYQSLQFSGIWAVFLKFAP